MDRPFPSYEGPEPYTFVCYAHEDSAAVYPEISWLREQGINIWYDEGISPGKNWRAVIGDALIQASHVLVFISSRSLLSNHCNREINLALDEGKDIIPVYLEKVDLTSDLKVGLSRVQALFRDSDVQFQKRLLDALKQTPATRIREFVERPHASTRPRILIALAAVLLMSVGWWYWNERSSLQTAGVRSIAVLPFENLSNTTDEDFFVAGMHDALIGELAHIPSLRVISRKSTLHYRDSEKSLPQIANELNVDAIVEGSVMRVDGNVRIQAELVQAFPEETQLWAHAYDGEIDDVLALHRDVVESIAQAIEVKVSLAGRAARVVDPATYEAYLKGMYFLHQETTEGNQKGIAYLQEAVGRDPADPLAHAALAMGYAGVAHGPSGSKRELFRSAEKEAQQALGLDDTVAEAYVAIGEVKSYFDWDWEGAEKSFRRAIELNPSLATAHYHYGWMLAAVGRNDDATNEMILARNLDPLNPEYGLWLAGWYGFLGRNQEAIDEALKVREYAPNSMLSRLILGIAYRQDGQFEKAIVEHEIFATLWRPALGTTLTYAGRIDEARKIREDIEQDETAVSTILLARFYAVLGDKDSAFRTLSRALDVPEAFAGAVRYDPDLRNLHGDPRYDALLRRMHLVN